MSPNFTKIHGAVFELFKFFPRSVTHGQTDRQTDAKGVYKAAPASQLIKMLIKISYLFLIPNSVVKQNFIKHKDDMFIKVLTLSFEVSLFLSFTTSAHEERSSGGSEEDSACKHGNLFYIFL